MKSKERKIQMGLLLLVSAVFIWSVIKPPAGYLEWLLEVSPAVIGLIIVLAIYNKYRFTTLSYVIIAILAILMFVGGHYTYSKVPLFNWIKETFDLHRNNYDRFGHFLKGLLAIVIREILLRKKIVRKGAWLFITVVSMILAIAAFYEIIEWSFSEITKEGHAAKNFMDTQGDKWDTQWDMTCALTGSVVALLLFSNLHNRLLAKKETK